MDFHTTFRISRWDEKTYTEHDGVKLTRVTTDKTYRGSVAGTSTTEWLLAYRLDGICRFVGLEHFSGTIDGKSGTLTFESGGTYAATGMKSDVTILPGTGTGELAGITGTVEIPNQEGHPEEYPAVFHVA